MMRIDIREHIAVRETVRSGIVALCVQGRQIWGDTRHTLPEIVVRLMVGVGDLARVARGEPSALADELKKELGNVLFSTVRWIDDLGLDPLECLDLAIAAQEKFARSDRPR